QNLDAMKAWNYFNSKLNFWQRRTLAPLARWLLRRIKRFYIWRELCRSNMVRVAWPMRLIHLELAHRFVNRGWIESRDNYFFLIPSDVERAITNSDAKPSMTSIVTHRKSEWQRFANLEMPLLMNEANLPAILHNTDASIAFD